MIICRLSRLEERNKRDEHRGSLAWSSNIYREMNTEGRGHGVATYIQMNTEGHGHGVATYIEEI